MGTNIKLTEEQLDRMMKRLVSEGYYMNESSSNKTTKNNTNKGKLPIDKKNK